METRTAATKTDTQGRRLRAFKRWMKAKGIECSNALQLCVEGDGGGSVAGVGVQALCDLSEGDGVAKIPKNACLTVRTCGAHEVIEDAMLGGTLGLAVALMYERSQGCNSSFFEYLQLLPHQEPVPLVWSPSEIDSLLLGTELHQVVKEDAQLLYEDWKESIVPLTLADPVAFPIKWFSLDHYFAAKTLVGSRAFEVDDYHGFGMVPLADLFNHKTAAEDIHFTCVSNDHDCDSSDSSLSGESGSSYSERTCHNSSNDSSSGILEMILVKDVKEGSEVFNTYGTLSNAALLHRYGFTEPDNPYDIVNIDLDVVVDSLSSSISSGRHVRACVSLWRRLGFNGCGSQDSEYFEILSDGKPQSELLMLAYIACLSDEDYQKLNIAASQCNGRDEDGRKLVYLTRYKLALSHLHQLKKIEMDAIISDEWLVTTPVCLAISKIADAREKLYGTTSVQEDQLLLTNCLCSEHPKLFHSFSLRISERVILQKLRAFAAKHEKDTRSLKSRPEFEDSAN